MAADGRPGEPSEHLPADRIRLAVIIGSTREGRFGPTVARWFAGRAGRHDDIDLDVIDLGEAWLPDVLSVDGHEPDGHRPQPVRSLARWLSAADAFVIVTPEYNHSFPGSLKTAIDWFRAEWQAKPVGFVSYGGLAGGLRAVEQLRLVFAELDAVTIRETVSFHNHTERFGEDGRPRDSAAEDKAADVLLARLGWWARALRAHRSRHPYGR
ncbi:NADPH-dependent FMN reductase [Kibdelosporangium persicum]|uniref:NADPH-dependent FMN reductase n=1 Tax=Kibdelosporangium persicum TaxID=2698649 RepID=UPI0028ACA796|nr:NAD(P)H-dependent oxidoreductase [Kibdelosporangium persicum]